MMNDIASTVTRDVLLGLSAFVIGVSFYMCWVHIRKLWYHRHRWDVWMLLIYAGVANTVGLVAELLWGVPGVPVTWRAISFGFGLLAISIGTIGIAYSTGRRDKRAGD